MNLSIQFKEKEIFNTNKITLNSIKIILINDFAFNFIIYIWYLLFIFGIIKSPNPFFALFITLIQNILTYIYVIFKGISKENLLKYTIILIIMKIFPLLSFNYQENLINYYDIYLTINIYLIYVLILIFIYDILLKKNIDIFKIVFSDLFNENYDKKSINNTYDIVYHDIIKRII